MPYEAFPVRPIRDGWMGGNITEEDTANRICEIYQEVENRGGEIVGDHTVGADFAPSTRRYEGVIKFLVAHFPEQSDSSAK